jgi:hypothetical protein
MLGVRVFKGWDSARGEVVRQFLWAFRKFGGMSYGDGLTHSH